MAVFWTSDLHFSHANVIRYCSRPFATVEEMNEALVRNWNEVVGPEDTVYCLGDFSLSFSAAQLFSKRLMGKKKLVPGNHDWCHPSHKKARGERIKDQIKAYEDLGWEVLSIFSEYDFEGVARVNVCHLPYRFDSTDDRHSDYRLVDDGRFLICGHVHEKWTKKGKMINVGVDRHNYRPISSSKVIELINTEGDFL